MKFFTQSATLILACSVMLVIISTPLAGYMIPILGFVIAISVIFIILRQRKNRGEEVFVGSNKEIFTITLALLIAIFLTGGLSSNLFFLLYFILFGLVFLFEPPTVFVLFLGLVAVFFPSLDEGDLLSSLIKLGSLGLLTPISYFFGREFQKREKLAEEIEDKTGQIIEDVQTLKSQRGNKDENQELDDIVDKANELRQEAENK